MNENKNIYMPLLQEAKKRRQSQGISALALSKKLGWSPTQLYRFERGEFDVKTSTLIKYLDACGYNLVIEKKEPDLLREKRANQQSLIAILTNTISQASEQLKSLQEEVGPEEQQTLEYQLLARLRSDCEYALNTGENKLWAGNVQEQIDKMRELYNGLEVKPEWITPEDIDEYERKFNEVDSSIDEIIDDIEI